MARPEIELEPLGARVVVEKNEEKSEDDNVLSSVDNNDGEQVVIYRAPTSVDPNKENTGKVIAVGPECKGVGVGDEILYVRHLGDACLLDSSIVIMHEDDILARVKRKAMISCA